jgi:hypothetical protein
MKKLLLLTLFSSLLFVAGCSKDDDNPTGPGGSGKTTISGKIEGWNLGAGKTINLTHDYTLGTIFGSATVAEDGSFSIEASYPSVAAPLMGYYDGEGSCTGNVALSNNDAKYWVSFMLISDNTGVIAYVDKQVDSETMTCNTIFFYVDRDVTVSGSETCDASTPTNYNMNMKAGWNLIYDINTSENEQLTTTEPAGAKYVLTTNS